jgi:hypothetical protein
MNADLHDISKSPGFKERRRANLARQEGAAYAGMADLEMMIARLGRSYDALHKQATNGFVLTCTFFVLGVFLLLGAAAGDFFGMSKQANGFFAIAGLVVETFSAFGAYWFHRAIRRLNATADRLQDLWRLLAAFKKAEELPIGPRSDLVTTLINRLVEPNGRSWAPRQYVEASSFVRG